MKRYTLILLLVCLTTFQLRAQNDDASPEIGKACPDFTLKEVMNYPKKEVSLKDFAGKWLVLDFWSSGCTSCIASFPKMNELSALYQDKVQFIIVGKDDKHIRRIYDNVHKRYTLSLTAAYDTLMFKQFDIGTVPHVVVIDPQGIIRAITITVTKANIEDFLSGKNPRLPIKYGIRQSETAKKNEVKSDVPLLINGNGGSDTSFIYRSVLLPWKRSMGQVMNMHFTREDIYGNKFRVVGANLEMLYQSAYGDTLSTEPFMNDNHYEEFARRSILEISDSSAFKHDWATGEGVYAYEVILQKGLKRNTDQFRKMMRNDLENYFQFDVKVERRMMPYWRLEATQEAIANLKTKGGKPISDYQKDEVNLRNVPMAHLITALWYPDAFGPPIINCTGIKGNIDISYTALSIDFEDIRTALLKKGITLVKALKMMDVVVVKDRLKQ